MELPILRIVDTATAFSECLILPSPEIPEIISAIVRRWFSVYGAPFSLSGDVEFSRSTQFQDFLKYFFVDLEPRPARRHNKNSSLEAKHGLIRKLVLRLLSDASSSAASLSGPSFDLSFAPGAPSSSPDPASPTSLSVSDFFWPVPASCLTFYMWGRLSPHLNWCAAALLR